MRTGRPITYPTTDGNKICNCCKNNFSIENFYWDINNNRLRAECKKCCAIKSKIRGAKNRDKRRASDIKRRYSITIEDYNKILYEQNNRCAICQKESLNEYRSLSVDHCHITEKVRGLLCQKCNAAIGLLNDDINLLNKAIDYLKQHQSIGINQTVFKVKLNKDWFLDKNILELESGNN